MKSRIDRENQFKNVRGLSAYDPQVQSFIVAFNSWELARFSDVLCFMDRPKFDGDNRAYLYASDIDFIYVGWHSAKAISFRDAYLAVRYLSRSDPVKKLQGVAIVERTMKEPKRIRGIRSENKSRLLEFSRRRRFQKKLLDAE